MRRKQKQQPSPAKLEQIACGRQPELINAFVAYFVFEWQTVTSDENGLHGKDQTGIIRFIPDYIGMYGMDACLDTLHTAPRARDSQGPGRLSYWMRACAYD